MVDLRCTFPDKFFEEKERCGYTVSAQMKKIWVVEQDLLNELAQLLDRTIFNVK